MSDEPATSALRALADLPGANFERLKESELWAGCPIEFCIEPETGAVLADVLEVLSGCEQSALITGGASKLELINRALDTKIRLSCSRLAGVDECDAADGVLHARAGTKLLDIAAVADEAGWLLPLDAPGEGGTLGGVLATGACGPRRLAYGEVRDNVLGLDTVLASGERTHCGARVVKNVTGYDMAKLYVGSFGTLAVIEGAWLRLRPKPVSVSRVEVSLGAGQQATELALETARRISASSVALVSEALAAGEADLGPIPKSGADWRLLAEFSGDDAITRLDTEWLLAKGPNSRPGPEYMEALTRLQSRACGSGLRARIHLLPSNLGRVCGLLRDAGLDLLVYPEPGVIYASFEPEPDREPSWLPHMLVSIDESVSGLEANWVIESLPDWGYSGRDVFRGDSVPALMNTLKRLFDPVHILNRGCFVGSP